ncbi:hypothetical protein D3C73_840960 [compost metagenome]
MTDRLLQPFSRRLDVSLARTAQPLLLRFQCSQCRFVLLDPAAKLKGQLIAVLLQMEETLEHLSAVNAPQ